MSYREYFDIDPDYFPQVDKQLIEEQPDLWKKFWPHPSFVQLLKAMVDVLERKQKLSIWVDGAYGTGKSHAVLTLKKLIEASDEETTAYFQKYELDDFICKRLLMQKKEGKILVCHRYGSSDIQNDTDLIVAIQEGIEKALAEAGIENNADASLKNSLIRYFENEENRQSFDIYAKGTYKTILGGDLADDILKKLKEYDEEALRSLIGKIFKVPTVSGGFSMNTGELCDWIREIIAKNNLKELVFMWDEFSEYFENNMHHLTGFQQIAELAATAPFCLLIVTHKAEGYFSDGDPDKKKILDRFVPPVHISLPENIAFELMNQAMKKTSDEDKAAKWDKNKGSLENRTAQSRVQVRKAINITDGDLSNVLPIHPYAALLLQHISIYYTSTARSMFTFIKNDEGEDVQAFQWFIDRYDFKSTNPFFTADMLWNFFYETGSEKLTSSIKNVLSCYTAKLDNTLMDEQKRVLKTILLLQAVSENMSGKQEVFLPNNKNLSLAFEGTDLEGSAPKIANKLLTDHVVTRTPLTGEVFSYCCKNSGPIVDTALHIPTAKQKSTKDMTLMGEGNLRKTIEFTGALKLRYSLAYATLSDFDSEIKKANNPSAPGNKIYAVSTIARDPAESAAVKKKIENFFEANPDSDVVVIDSSNHTMSETQYAEFIENYAMALAIGNSDIDQRKTYEKYAMEVIDGWAKQIKNGDFYVYSCYAPKGDHAANMSDMFEKLMDINKFHYPKCLEGEFTSVNNTMYDANSLNNGAICGISQETKGAYKSANEATKLENALSGAWNVSDYWVNSHSYIAELKKAVEKLIKESFENAGDRISIAKIYDFLKAEPYGFMPCNLTSFILGFLLKEYANGVYSYCDNLTTVPLDTEKLAMMISEVIKLENTADKHYKDKYIVTLTEREREFNKATSVAFDIPEQYCVSITETRSRIRNQMKTFSFPIWVIKYVLNDKTFTTSKDIVANLIDHYCGIANNRNMEGEMSDNDIALAIGQMCLDNPGAAQDLKSVLTKDNCKSGMLEYLKTYAEGKLPSIAARIGDGGQYINQLEYKFNSDAANWVWNTETANSKIDELICEYEIIENSNSILTKNTTYIDTMAAWIDKLGQIKVAYAAIKNELGDEKPFYDMLCTLYKQKSLLDSQKKNFLTLLELNADGFKQFMGSQVSLFKKAFKYYLDDLTEDDIEAILEDDTYAFEKSFALEPDKYTEKVQKAVAAYKGSQSYTLLKKHWHELTGTDTPFDWSRKYSMPIFAMVPESEEKMAKTAFNTICYKPKDEEAIAKAEDYISKMTYVDKLNSEVEREKAFREVLLREYSVLFDDVDEVKSYLRDHTSETPHSWMGSKEVTSRIKEKANAAYMESGYGKAKQVIDEMPIEQLKEYLKSLIGENVTVGVEIIKGKK